MCCGGFAGAALAISSADKPDLVLMLPDRPRSDQVAPVYVDAYEKSGSLLYRFDAVILNRGGTLDLSGDTGDDHGTQALWPGGDPGSLPDPNRPPGSDATLVRIGSGGRTFVYGGDGHAHWHFVRAARYELAVPGAPARVSAKVGFCMFDTWPPPQYFERGYEGSGPSTWCQPGRPGADFVRMGISPGAGDLYRSQLPRQWVDVAGLPPGSYTLRGVANPAGVIEESTLANNAAAVVRTIPGTVAAPAEHVAPKDEASMVVLSGKIVGADIPARKSGSCKPKRSSWDCYVVADERGPLSFRFETPPAHGTVDIVRVEGRVAEARYTPDPGYVGPDSFTYTVRDVRKLTSAPATVTIEVRSPPTVTVPPPSMDAPRSTFSTRKSIGVGWGVGGTPGWLASYDVRYRAASTRSRFGDHVVWLTATGDTQTTFVGRPGRAYCFSARARDIEGNASRWSAEACTSLPVDDRKLARRGTWREVHPRGAYKRTLSLSRRRGAALERGRVATRELALLVWRCPGCGTVDVFWNGSRLARVRLEAETRAPRTLVWIASFERVRRGAVTLRVVSRGKPVKIDGLAASRVAGSP